MMVESEDFKHKENISKATRGKRSTRGTTATKYRVFFSLPTRNIFLKSFKENNYQPSIAYLVKQDIFRL